MQRLLPGSWLQQHEEGKELYEVLVSASLKLKYKRVMKCPTYLNRKRTERQFLSALSQFYVQKRGEMLVSVAPILYRESPVDICQ
jgi:hypothetical protein